MIQGDGESRLEIRRLQGADEARACAQVLTTSEPWVTLRRTYAESMAALDDPVREAYVALVDGELAGFMILRMDGAFIGYIQTLAVLPGWRGRGVGTRLIQYAEERIFRETPNVFICASSFNPRAQRLYERLGYEVVGELKDFIVPGHAEILMRKTIGPRTEYRKRRDA